ncbi:MAG: hypothetical protein ACXWW0_07865, partial [Bacteroidia bacterium]
CLFTFLPWIFYILQAFPQEANWVLKKFIYAYSDAVEGHSAPAYYYLQQLGVIFGELIYLPMFLGLYFLFKRKAGWQMWMMNIWWIIPVIIFSMADMKRHTYMLIFAPALFIIGAYFWFYLLSVKEKFKYPLVIKIILVLLIILPVRYGFERTKPFRQSVEPEWSISAKQLKSKIPQNDKAVIYNVDHYIETMFYSGLTAYHYIPDMHEVDSLQKHGFSVYVIDNNKLDNRFDDNKEVKFLQSGSGN